MDRDWGYCTVEAGVGRWIDTDTRSCDQNFDEIEMQEYEYALNLSFRNPFWSEVAALLASM